MALTKNTIRPRLSASNIRPSIFSSKTQALLEVEAIIKSKLISEASLLTEVAHYLLSLGGKRIRPLIVLTSAELFGQQIPSPAVLQVAAGIELIHMATLLHDDIIDESPIRRTQTSAYQAFGVTPTLLTGDYLLVKAFGICAQLDKLIIEATERACIELTEGELLEGQLQIDSGGTALNDTLSYPRYRNVIEKKTASLFWLSCLVGAHLAGAGEAATAKAAEFGRRAGVTFQMIDDILDITANEAVLGKPVGTDLRQRTPSLINIVWLESGDPFAREFFANDKPSKELCDKAVTHLRNSKIIEECRSLAAAEADQAEALLSSLAPYGVVPEVAQQLSLLIRYTLNRCT